MNGAARTPPRGAAKAKESFQESFNDSISNFSKGSMRQQGEPISPLDAGSPGSCASSYIVDGGGGSDGGSPKPIPQSSTPPKLSKVPFPSRTTANDDDTKQQQQQQSSNSIDYKEKANKYKAENKKLRKESLLLKAKLEEIEQKKGKGDDAKKSKELEEKCNAVAKENEKLKGGMSELQRRYAELEGKLKEKDKADEEEAKLRMDLDKKGGLSNMPHEKLVEENVHLTKLLLEVSL